MIVKENLINIAGPCAVESPTQINIAAKELAESGQVQILRGCAFKPRTSHPKNGHFFDGTKQDGISWLIDAGITYNIPIATEVIVPEHVIQIAEILNQRQQTTPLLLWIGSRNQNHIDQTEISKLIKGHLPEQTLILIKNQPWGSESHWKGIASHVINGAKFPQDRVLFCHRGFDPYGIENPDGFRNIPDFKMAMRVKKETGIPMILDPSHIAGSVENIFKVVKMAKNFDFDGLMIEVHPDPKNATTDAKQQLTIEEFKDLMDIVNQSKNEEIPNLDSLRLEINSVDTRLLELLQKGGGNRIMDS